MSNFGGALNLLYHVVSFFLHSHFDFIDAAGEVRPGQLIDKSCRIKRASEMVDSLSAKLLLVDSPIFYDAYTYFRKR